MADGKGVREMRLKWKMNNVSATRGNTSTCIAKFDNSHVWLQGDAIMSVQTFKSNARAIADLFGAKAVEIKYLHADDAEGTLTEPRENIVMFSHRYGTDYRFFTESVDSSTGRAKINYLAPEAIFRTECVNLFASQE